MATRPEASPGRNVAELAERDAFVHRVTAAFRIGADQNAPIREQYCRTAAGIDAMRSIVAHDMFRLRRRQLADLMSALEAAHRNLARYFHTPSETGVLLRGFECCAYLVAYWGADQASRDARGDFFEDASSYAFVLSSILVSSATIMLIRSRDQHRQALGAQTFEALCQGSAAKRKI